MSVSDTNLTLGDANKLHHHIVNVIVLQVRVISDWRVSAGLVPAKVLRRVVSIGKDALWMGGGQEGKMFTSRLSWSIVTHFQNVVIHDALHLLLELKKESNT